MKRSVRATLLALMSCGLVSSTSMAESFRDLLGGTSVGSVKQTSPLTVPYITWGGDMATFHANGGLVTKPGTVFNKQGLTIKLVPGDNFVQQVKSYLAGDTPFLRGTLGMIGLASEVIAEDPRTRGVVILQMTWSAGDHMVVREDIKTVKDLKGKTIVLQKAGPHVSMLDDILKTTQLGWKDITVMWAQDLTGSSNCPSEIFRKDPRVSACFVISPDMIGLCGGLQNIGSGAEGTVKGSRVLVSTAQLSRSIADVYVCRKDFYDSNRDLVTQFVAGYLKGTEEVVDLKNQYETKGSAPYMELLKLTQSIYGKEVIPTLEEDAHGLLCDCTFVGYPGNQAFFLQANNLHGFAAMQKASLELAVGLGYASKKVELMPSGLDYNAPAFVGYLSKTQAATTERFEAEAVRKEIEDLSTKGGLDDRTIYSFTINFDANQSTFPEALYGSDYQRVVELADKYGNAVVAVRGHSDPTRALGQLVQAGMAKGIIQRTGSTGNYKYSCKGKPLDLTATDQVVKLIETGDFEGVIPDCSPRETSQAAQNLSLSRATAVRNSVITYAKGKALRLDESQVQAVGVGIREPFIAKPTNDEEAKQNRRVEFVLMRVDPEASRKTDFDF